MSWRKVIKKQLADFAYKDKGIVFFTVFSSQ